MAPSIRSIQQALAASFPESIRERGKPYFFGRRVRLAPTNGESSLIAATVQGARQYEVHLVQDGEALLVSCECPYFQRDEQLCKHIWATILEAGSRGRFAEQNTPTSVRIQPGPVRHLTRPEPAAEDAESSSEPRSRPWRVQLEQLSQPELGENAPLAAEAEIIYILDLASSKEEKNLVLEVASRGRRKDGQWAKTRPFSLRLPQIRLLPEKIDQEILAVLASARSQNSGSYASVYDTTVSRHRLPWPMPEFLLPMLGSSGRLWLRGEDRRYRTDVSWEDASPWELTVKVERDEVGRQYRLQGFLRRDGEQMGVPDPLLIVEGGLVVTENAVARLDDHGAYSWISLLRKEKELLVPFAERERLRSTIMAIRRRPPLDLPDELRWEEVRREPQPRLRLSRRRERAESYEPLMATLSFDYDEEIVDGETEEESISIEEGRVLVRDMENEQAYGRRLEDLGLTRTWSPGHYRLHPATLPSVVRELLSEGWQVEAEEGIYRAATDFQVELNSGVDWFELNGNVSFGDGVVGLPALLRALKKKESFIRLEDGSVGLIPEEWLERYAPLIELADESRTRIRFQKNRVALLDVLLASRPEIELDLDLARIRDRIRTFDGIDPLEPPSGFQGELRPYQKEGLGWFAFLEEVGFGGCLADDMGLGKTIQVLALLESRREKGVGRPSLVVVPRSLLFNWREEARRFTPRLRVIDHTGADRKRQQPDFSDADLVLTTYGTLRRDIGHLSGTAFDYVVLDEAQAIKNSSTQAARAVRLLHSSHRLALSGTPIENHLGELWSLFEFLNPGMLGRAAAFRRSAMTRGGDDASRELLRRALRPFILRRTKAQVARDLPEKVEQTVFCDLEARQRKLYDELRDFYRESLLGKLDSDGLRRSRIQVLEALLRLRQAACHPGLIDPARRGHASAKLDVLIPEIQVVLEEGHKALVFSQFTSMLSIVRERLEELGIDYGYLDGKSRDRQQQVERFQSDPDRKLFLISLRAGGLGLNLTAAEYVFLLDPWWNPAVEAQAIDRAHRIGQQRNVFAYRLVARDTVEEKILELQGSKRDLADAIINEDNSVLGNLSLEDLELLLS